MIKYLIRKLGKELDLVMIKSKIWILFFALLLSGCDASFNEKHDRKSSLIKVGSNNQNCNQVVVPSEKEVSLFFEQSSMTSQTEWNYHYIASDCYFYGKFHYKNELQKFLIYPSGYGYYSDLTNGDKNYFTCYDCEIFPDQNLTGIELGTGIK